jgi:hypothetical protein
VRALWLALAMANLQDGPQPRVVGPGGPGKAPSDAVVLFDGSDAAAWSHVDGKPARWEVKEGALVCLPDSGSVRTRAVFGDAQVHVEFATPLMPDAKGQPRGNSGVYLQGRYEVQILDSHGNERYPDGSCGAIYKQHAPLVNACRPPGEWQTYDIVFRAPRRDVAGKVVRPGTMTVFLNGVLIQDHAELRGPTGGALDDREGEPGPLVLQDHGNLVRFRNVWLRPLAER